MKILATLFVVTLAIVLVGPLVPLMLPVLIIGAALALPVLIVTAVGTALLTVIAGIGKLAVGLVSVMATLLGLVLLPLLLLLIVGGAIVTCLT